jgi:hypothetical protein
MKMDRYEIKTKFEAEQGTGKDYTVFHVGRKTAYKIIFKNFTMCESSVLSREDALGEIKNARSHGYHISQVCPK